MKDIKNLLEKGRLTPLIVLDSADLEWPNDFDEFLRSLNVTDSQRTMCNKTIKELKSDMLSTEDKDFSVDVYRPAYEDTNRRGKEILGYFTKFFVADLSSSNRLLLASSVNSVDPETNHPANLLQALFLDGSYAYLKNINYDEQIEFISNLIIDNYNKLELTNKPQSQNKERGNLQIQVMLN